MRQFKIGDTFKFKDHEPFTISSMLSPDRLGEVFVSGTHPSGLKRQYVLYRKHDHDCFVLIKRQYKNQPRSLHEFKVKSQRRK